MGKAAVTTGLIDVSAATNTTDFTVAGFGTVTGCLVIYGSAGSDGDSTTRRTQGIGITDFTTQRAHMLAEFDGSASAATSRHTRADGIVYASSVSAKRNYLVSAAAITDGVRFTCDARGASILGVAATVILFGGGQCYVADFPMLNVSGVKTLATPFDPKAVIAVNNGIGQPTTTASHALMSLGFADAASGNITHAGYCSVNGSTLAKNTVTSGDVAIASNPYLNSPGWQPKTVVFGTNQLQVTPVNATAGSDVMSVLVFDTDVPIQVGIDETPTTTGDVSYSTTFDPSALLMFGAHIEQGTQIRTDYRAGGFTWFATDGKQSGSHVWNSECGADPTVVDPERLLTSEFKTKGPGGSTIYSADVAPGDGGFTARWNTVPAIQREIGWLAVGGGPGVATLVAGAAAGVDENDGSVDVAAEEPTGGQKDYSYQWERSTVSGSGFASVAGATSLTLSDSGLTNGTTYYYRLQQADFFNTTVTTAEVALTPAAAVLGKPTAPPTLKTIHPLLADFLHAWVMTEGSGTGSVDSVGTNDLTIIDAVWATDTQGDVALEHDASNQQAIALDSTVSLLADEDWTVAWSAEGAGGFLGDNTNSDDRLQFRETTVMRFENNTGGTINFSPVSYSGYHDYVLSHSVDGGLSLYQDGIQVGTTNTTVSHTLSINTLLGAYTNNLYSFDGTMTYAFVWKGRALTEAEAADIATDPYDVFVDGAASLTAGTATTTSAGDAIATVTATDATGGTPSYSYQWERSTVSGSGFADVVGATSLTLNDTGLTNGTTYYYRLRYTDTAAGTATSNETTATPTGTTPVIIIPPHLFTF